VTRLVTVAHGTRTPAGNQVALQLTAAAGEQLGIRATASYVELCEPLFSGVVSRLREHAVVVPLLLSTGVHVRRDLPAAVDAGSSDPDALVELEAASRLLAELWGAPVRLATLAGIGPRLDEVVQPGDAVSPYLLAPGYFGNRARVFSLAAGASVVAPVIGTHPRAVDLVRLRARQLLRAGSRVSA